MATFADYKKAVAIAIDDVIDMGLRDKRLTMDDSEKAKSYFTAHIQDVNFPEDLIRLLENMTKQWQVFNYLLTIEKNKFKRDTANPNPIPPERIKPGDPDAIYPKIKEIEKLILDTIISELGKKTITQEDSQPIAQWVLNHIDTVTNFQELDGFLEELVSQWPIFKPILDIEKGQETRKQEDVAAQDMAALLKSGNTKKAIELANTVMES